MPTVVNLVITAALGRAVNLQRLADRFPHTVHYNSEWFPGILIHVDRRTKIQLFRSGRMIMTGARSLTLARRQLPRTMTELGLRRPRNMTVVNMVATWTVAPRAAAERHVLDDPKAHVNVSASGKVVCLGVTSRADLKRVYDTIQ